MKLVIEIHGESQTDLRDGLLAIKESLERGNTSGFDRRELGHYRFELEEAKPERVLSWTHACCESCWVDHCLARGVAVGEPTRVKGAKIERCCFCGNETHSGIYVRHNPEDLTCTHPEKA